MSDTEAPRIAASPGLIGQSHPASTIAAAIVACIAGAALTCAIGSLVFLLDPGHYYLTETNLAGIGVSGVNGVQKAARYTVAIFIFEWWTAIIAWVAVTAAVCGAFVLNATFAIFRRADWSTVLLVYVCHPFVLTFLLGYTGRESGASDDMIIRLILLFSGSIIGVLPVHRYYSGFVASATYDALPAEPSTRPEDPSPADTPRTRPSSAFETRTCYANESWHWFARSKVRRSALCFALGLGLMIFNPAYVGGPLGLWLFTEGVGYGLYFLYMRHAAKRNGERIVVDQRGISDGDGTIPWSEIGRTWLVSGPGNEESVVVEISAKAARHILKTRTWIGRVVSLGYPTLIRKHIGANVIGFSTLLLDVPAEEISEAIESRRPPRTQFVPAAAPAG